MTPAERAQILVTARLLEAAAKIDTLSTGLTLLAAAAMLFGVRNGCFAIAGIVVIALGVVAKVYSVRIAFDARLLSDIALGQFTDADLDAAFPAKAGRVWSDRLRGAKRLVSFGAIATIAQCIAIIVMALWTSWT
jgi:hypothetical protein